MPLTIKKSNWDPSTSLSNASPLQKSLWAKFSVYPAIDNENENWDSKLPQDLLDKTFSVVLSEPIELQIETDWTESGGAEIAKRVNQIFNPKAIRALAGNNANSHAPNDKWTQKTTEMGKPLNAKLKFRIYDESYDEPNNKNQTYTDVIKFLTIACAPRIEYSLATNALDPLLGAAANSKKFFNDLKIAQEDYKKDKGDNATVLGTLEAGIKAVRPSLVKRLTSENRYNYTIKLESNVLKCEEGDKDGGYKFHPDWYIKSFNWLPSNEMIMPTDEMVKNKNRQAFPYPLWLDFEIDLETCIVWPKELLIKNIR